MVTESPRAITAAAGELLARAAMLRADAGLMDGCARKLLATAAALSGCAAAPGGSRPALERQAAACTTAADQLRHAARALEVHARAGAGKPGTEPSAARG